MEWISDPQIWIAFLTLTVLELVLGIDNIIFISILSGKLPADPARVPFHRAESRARNAPSCCCSLSWIIGLTEPLFTKFGKAFQSRPFC